MSEPEEESFGLAFGAGDARHYRSYIGPPKDYDLIGGLQFTLLFQAGLRETHRLLDLGCGSLRGGRLFIPYLRPGHYYGVEPNEWLVEEGLAHELGAEILRVKRPTFSTIDDFSLASLGVRFDYVIAQSVLSHTFPDVAARAFAGIRDCLEPHGVLLATFFEGDGRAAAVGWSYPANVPYSWAEITDLGWESGLHARRVTWPHPRQSWFVAGLDGSRVEEASDLIEAGKPVL